MRITSRIMMDRALSNFTSVQAKLAEFQEQLSTGKRIRRPSDDPAGMTRALAIRRNQRMSTQYRRDIDAGLSRLTATEAGLGSVTDLLQRARELAVAASNDTVGQTERAQRAAEVQGLLDEAVTIGNLNFAGQYLFAGHQTTAAPFTPVGSPATAVTYTGDTGVIERDVSVGVRVTVNIPGDQAFGGVFTTLIALRDAMQSGDTTTLRTSSLADLDAELDKGLQIRGQLASATRRLEGTRDRLEQADIAEKQQLTEIEDADIVETIVNLNAQQMVYEAALASAARGMSMTLLNFLS